LLSDVVRAWARAQTSARGGKVALHKSTGASRVTIDEFVDSVGDEGRTLGVDHLSRWAEKQGVLASAFLRDLAELAEMLERGRTTAAPPPSRQDLIDDQRAKRAAAPLRREKQKAPASRSPTAKPPRATPRQPAGGRDEP
jgi:hypothetical protein